MASSEPTVFKIVCPLDCPDTCSMRVTVQDGAAIDLKGDAEHAFTRGFLSSYGTMGKLQVSSLDRRFFHRLGASKL